MGLISCQIASILVLAVSLAGCMSVKHQQTGIAEVVLVATSDQKFIVDGNKVGVEEFYEKVEFNRSAPEVKFFVAQNSLVLESTVKELVKIFKSKGYVVIMAPGSKYPSAAL